jgi:tetratricopeptide (TPR) repeat protein
VFGEAGIREAVGRSLVPYLHTMIISSPHTPRPFTPVPPAPGVTPERLADTRRVGWARAEDQVLLQAVAQAAAAGFITRAWQIFERLSWFLGDQGYWADCQATSQTLLAAAQAAGDQTALGWTHLIIGRYCAFTGAHDENRAHQQQALDNLRRAGDLPGQGWAHLYAALACRWDEDWAGGLVHCKQALPPLRQAGDHDGQALALAGLGTYHARLGHNDLARGCAQQALDLAPYLTDPTNLAFAWDALALVHSRLGEHPRAISCYRQALALGYTWQTPLARRWLAGLLADFGDACRAAGDLPAACQAWQQALQFLHDLGLPEDPRTRAKLNQAGPASRPG